jgi:serine/threonine-protein kinase HipA
VGDIAEMMLPNNALTAFLHDASGKRIRLGRLTAHEHVVHFEYDPDYLNGGLSLSPLRLPLQSGQIAGPADPFQGLHGVFADSLPDGWGLLLTNRIFQQRGMSLRDIGPLHRLSYLGNRTMGALTYEPDLGIAFAARNGENLRLPELAEQSARIFEGSVEEVLPLLAQLGGSPQGARPKAAIALCGNRIAVGTDATPEGFSHWLVKFPTGTLRERNDESATEYAFAQMAVQASIDMAPTQLIAGIGSDQYFATQRFDRVRTAGRVHMHTLAGLLHANYRIPDCDYEQLLKATKLLTQSELEVEKAYRLMIFNILSGNRDDHTKNFSFLLQEGRWRLSPAYDLTNSPGINGYRSMSVACNASCINRKDIQKIAKAASISPMKADEILAQTLDALSAWPAHVKSLSISKDTGRSIQSDFHQIARAINEN